MLRLAFIIILFFPLAAVAQLHHVGHELFYEDDGSIDDYPEDFKTWRIFAYMESPLDQLASCWANNGHSLSLGSSTNVIWNHIDGEITGGDLDPIWFQMWGSLPYDSFITIGRETVDDLGGDIYIVDLFGEIEAAFDAQFPWFELDENLIMEEGTWFSLPDSENSVGVEVDGLYRVLLAQITTDGEPSYTLNVQVDSPELGMLTYVADPTNIEDDQIDGSNLGLTFPEPGCLDPAPSNDLLENSTPISVGSTIEGTTCCATPDPTLCSESDVFGVWYSMNSGDYENISFELTNLTGANVAMTIWEETGPNEYTEFACCAEVTTVCTGLMNAFEPLVPYTNYYFMPHVSDMGNCGEFSLEINYEILGCTTPGDCNYDPQATWDDATCIYASLSNDYFDSPTPVIPWGDCQSYNFCFCSDSPEWPGHFDMWYEFDAPSDEFIVNVSSYYEDIALGLFTVWGDQITEVDANFTVGSESLHIVNPTETTYILGVSSAGPSGIIEFCFAPELLEGDFNLDGLVNTIDLLIFLGDLGCEGDCIGDLDGDGLVSVWDLLMLLGLIG